MNRTIDDGRKQSGEKSDFKKVNTEEGNLKDASPNSSPVCSQHEKAMISRQFIEAILQVPVSLCTVCIEEIEACLKSHLPDFLKENFPFFITESMVQSFEPLVLYHITDFLSLNFNLFLYDNKSRAMIAGPYLTCQAGTDFCEQVLQDNGKNLSLLVPFHQFCLSLPIVGNSYMLEAMRTALKVVTGYGDEVPYRHYEPQARYSQEVSSLSPQGVEEATMELLEHRYYYEKLLLQEVAQGNQDMALRYYRQFSMDSRSIVRTEDPVRTSKNLSFSLNTMLRKSAETAGIHPVHLDIISSNFAMLIENSNSLKELEEFKSQMISVYCRFVQKNRLDQYSPIIRKAITYIRIHLADQLTLKRISEGIRVSPSYLSRLFNQEVHESISNYITRARIDKAAELLSFSRMSVQNIAFYVGFGDLNYFSRCFKKHKKKTPTQYRASSAIGA